VIRPRLLVAGSFCLLVAAMIASFAPTPLYPQYAAAWHAGPFAISVAFSGYPVGVVAVILGVGGLSDRIGRQRTMLVAAVVVMAGLLITSKVDSVALLTLARVVQGAGTGLAGSTAAAALADHHPRGAAAGAWLHALGSTIGMAAGPITSGWLSRHTANPLTLPYLVLAALTLIPFVLILLAGTDPAPQPERRLFQTVRFPVGIWRPFTVASASLIAINGCNGLFGAFSSRIVATGLHSTSELTTGRLMSVLILALGAGQLVSGRLDPWAGCRIGMAGIAVGMATTTAGTSHGSVVLTWTGCVVIGLGGGLAFLGSTRLIATSAPTGRRAETYAAWMVAGFVAMAAAALLSGSVLHGAAISHVLAWATALTLLLALYALCVRAVSVPVAETEGAR
jgi:MFS family permease